MSRITVSNAVFHFPDMISNKTFCFPSHLLLCIVTHVGCNYQLECFRLFELERDHCEITIKKLQGSLLQ